MADNVMEPEVAQQEFERWAMEMDIDLDVTEMDEKDLADHNKLKGRLLRALGNGSLEINEQGEAVFTPRRSKYDKPLTFHERTGADLMQMDGKKDNQAMKKTYAVMGSMCRVPAVVFSGLVGTDGKVCEGIFSFLMD